LTAATRARLVELFESNADAAFNVAYRILWNRSDAQDVVQDAFVKAAGSFDQLRDPGKVRSWLLGITYREALMLLRRRRDVPTDPGRLPDHAGVEPDPATVAIQAELAEALRAAIDRLPDPLRTAFVLRDVEELSIRDVAGVLGIGESAAKMRVTRAREMMRVALAGRM
jgi:RNA polymerase sigma-70 factor (ECF subfamily)